RRLASSALVAGGSSDRSSLPLLHYFRAEIRHEPRDGIRIRRVVGVDEIARVDLLLLGRRTQSLGRVEGVLAQLEARGRTEPRRERFLDGVGFLTEPLVDRVLAPLRYAEHDDTVFERDRLRVLDGGA